MEVGLYSGERLPEKVANLHPRGYAAAMSERVNAADAALRLSDLLDRVRDERETFVIFRGGEEAGQLTPMEPSRPLTLLGLIDVLKEAGNPDPQFADDLEEIQATQPPLGNSPWPS
jgi:antitoxin (DNA-binding transcriptional repressor) of toxin-antitoxin stability system